MATQRRSSRNQRREKCMNKTFAASSIDSTAVEEKLFGRPEPGPEPGSDSCDGPVVFTCGTCRLPVGDSSSWDGTEEEQNQIRLKCVTDNVLIGTDNRLMDREGKRSLCLIVDLACRGCRSPLGMMYTSTPKHLDHKRFSFCLGVAHIDSYVLGSARQLRPPEGATEQPVTLEYRGVVEQQVLEMKMLVLTMSQRLEEIEAGLREDGGEE
ncbi:protein Mis18-alpha [Cololabis saira]|uniref:protein Mis18-alpha n=1 Tax=Cololabis saira TaxID=129043 RepID=UPI002AD36627|nr:protein Mis18-alpha [Cololabis saira]